MRTQFLRRAVLSALVTASFTIAARADVLVVDANAGPYFDIATAVAVANAGDVVLVKSGFYGAFTIDAKSVAVIADAGATVNVGAGVRVQNLASTQHVTIAGLRNESDFALAPQLTISACAGSVRVTDCALGAGFGPLGGAVAPVVVVTSSDDVALHRCTLRANYDFMSGGAEAVRAQTSRVSLLGSSVEGGVGVSGTPGGMTGGPNTSGLEGKSGIVCRNSTLFVAGATVIGGPGGSGVGGSCSSPYDYPTGGGGGGVGLQVADAAGPASKVTVLDAALQGGDGGNGGSGNGGCSDAPDGKSGSTSEGAAPVELSGAQRTLASIAPTREGALMRVRFEGLAGDRVYLALSARANFEVDRALHGVVLVQTPLERRYMGTIDASGVLVVQLPVGELGAGVQVRLRHAQAFFVDTTNTGWVSGVATALLLDGAH
ncbi:MAG: hypothetical protein ACKVWV_11870 [Planctomycetota bacterium]